MGSRKAQIKVNKCWGGTKISRHMPGCCRGVSAELRLRMLPVHYHHYHPGCLCSHHGVQSLKEYIVPHTRAPAQQFTTIHMQRGCRPQWIPLSVQLSCCHTESCGRWNKVSRFLMASICGFLKKDLFIQRQMLLSQRNKRWNWKYLQ